MDVSPIITGQESQGIDSSQLHIDEGMEELLQDQERAEAMEENDNVKKDREKRLQRQRSGKKTSQLLLDKELDLKELFKENAHKGAEKKLTQLKKKYQAKFFQETQKIAEEALGKDRVNQLKDQVQLSATAKRQKQVKTAAKRALKPVTSRPEFHIEQTVAAQLSDQVAQEHRQVQKAKKAQSVAVVTQAQDQVVKQNKSELVQRYIQALSSDLFDKKSGKKAELRRLNSELQQNGVHTKEVQKLEARVRQAVFVDLKKQLKRSFTKLAMFYESNHVSQELLSSHHEYRYLRQMGDSLGIFQAAGEAEEAYKAEIKHEMSGFIAYELDASLVSSRLASNSLDALVKMFDRFNQMAGFSGFDGQAYIAQLQKKLEHLGLNPFQAPDQKGSLDTETGDKPQRREPEEGELPISEEEVAALQMALRYAIISHGMSDGLWPQMKSSVRVELLKRKLRKKMGIKQVEALCDQYRKVARLRLIFELRTCFEERASLVSVDDGNYELIKGRIKQTLRGLKRVGFYMSKTDIRLIRDQSNRAIFTMVKEEYLQLDVHMAMASGVDARLKQKKADYEAILKRLKDESNINEALTSSLVQNLGFLSDVSIIEAA